MSITATQIEETAARVRQEGLVAIVRGNYPLSALFQIAEILAAAAVPIVEVTLNSAGALEAIAALRDRFGDRLCVGAGTVRTAAQFEAAVAAGAQFTVAPNLDLATVAASLRRDILHLPGVFTPTEVHSAHAAGCRMVKLFPSDIVGPAYLKALRAPLDDVQFVPTGGISAENIGDYVRAGAVAAGIGSALVRGADQPPQDLAARAEALRQAWQKAAQP